MLKLILFFFFMVLQWEKEALYRSLKQPQWSLCLFIMEARNLGSLAYCPRVTSPWFTDLATLWGTDFLLIPGKDFRSKHQNFLLTSKLGLTHISSPSSMHPPCTQCSRHAKFSAVSKLVMYFLHPWLCLKIPCLSLSLSCYFSLSRTPINRFLFRKTFQPAQTEFTTSSIVPLPNLCH